MYRKFLQYYIQYYFCHNQSYTILGWYERGYYTNLRLITKRPLPYIVVVYRVCHLIFYRFSRPCYFMHYRSCQSPHIPLEDCLIYNPVSAKAKTTIYSVFPLLASAIALTHPFLDGAFLAISLFPEYHPDALILFQSVKLASIKPKNPLLFYKVIVII